MAQGEGILGLISQSILEADMMFFRYITANDTGSTGAHQSGFYIPKQVGQILLPANTSRDQNVDLQIKIHWNWLGQGLERLDTSSRLVYYRKNTRDEYRITRFGRRFPFWQDEYVGSLLILMRLSKDEFNGFVLKSDDDIENFFATYNLVSISQNYVLLKPSREESPLLGQIVNAFLEKYQNTKPSTREMAFWAQKMALRNAGCTREEIRRDPDGALLRWIENEYTLFRFHEDVYYKLKYSTPFSSCQELIGLANSIVNARRVRAGLSLEHHLSRTFHVAALQFETQVETELHKRPDFIFPSAEAYHSTIYDPRRLVCLAAKTTCKDRWRQILNEADRVPNKHLFTLQSGISKRQLEEMHAAGVTLVVPAAHKSTFDHSYQRRIMSLADFIEYVSRIQNI